LREAPRRAYALVTILPLAFVGTTTLSAGVESVFLIYLPMTHDAATRTTGMVNVAVTSLLLVFIVMIVAGSVLRWLTIFKTPEIKAIPA
jgi:carbon starvation protein